MTKLRDKMEFAPEKLIAGFPSLSDRARISLSSPDVVLFPGFCDVHVHFREPGFSYKETIRTGSLAAAHGGYTTVCTMPNLNSCSYNRRGYTVLR